VKGEYGPIETVGGAGDRALVRARIKMENTSSSSVPRKDYRGEESTGQ
jgi:hypothetical protein